MNKGSIPVKLNEKFYKTLMDSLLEGIYVIDRDRKITVWNKAAEELTGYKAEEIIGKPCREKVLMHVDDRGKFLCEIRHCPAAKAMTENESFEEELYLHHKDGHRVPVKTRISPIRDARGRVIGAIEMFSDNSSALIARQKLEEMQQLALLDPLTDIGNRRYAETNLAVRLNEFNRNGWHFGVLFLDIDHFKEINDLHGHDVGDKVLRMVAKTLSNAVRTVDIVCRWGGEEFVAFISNVKKAEKLYKIADKCRALVESSSLEVGDTTIHATLSIGAAVAKPGDTAGSIIKRVDELMYQSKTNGRNTVTMAIGHEASHADRD
jgi:diguanylate cyclase (GGDEF)-like protein/PAS domain S-box-containing protein